jgi:hypothetical protein
VDKLRKRGEPAGIRIVGGAALSLRYFERRATDDIDAKVHPAEPTMTAAAEVAEENGWPHDWLNSNATQFLPFARDEWEPLYDSKTVSIWVASAPMLLVMKLKASRPGRDDDDIANLLTLCDVNSIDEAEELYELYYPGEILEPKAHVMLTAIFTQGMPDVPETPPQPDFDAPA